MAMFLDLRTDSVGGWLAASVNFYQGTELFVIDADGARQPGDYQPISRQAVLEAVQGRNVLVATHGFNVNRSDGIDCLDKWSRLLQLTPQDVFLGLLWPGDSVWAHGLDYPEEPRLADESGKLLAPFLDTLLRDAASISFASHSLGARVILQTIQQMQTSPRSVTIMAGAIDDDCLNNEFQAAAAKAGRVSILASMSDEVLSLAFPLGNLSAGIIDQGHPWFRGALGRYGPASTRPSNCVMPFEIPQAWAYGHHHYLQVAPAWAGATSFAPQLPASDALPFNGDPGWQEAFSSAFVSNRFRSS